MAENEEKKDILAFMKYLGLVLLLASVNTTMGQRTLIKVNAGSYSRFETVVEAALSKPLGKSDNYKIVNIENGSSSAVEQFSDTRILFILPDSLEPQQSATYELVRVKPRKPANLPVQVIRSDKGLKIMVNNKNLLYYNTALVRPPTEFPDIYSRSGFIHPLYTPAGKILTDDFPKGHAHQHGIMMAWVNTLYKNQPHDFWNQHTKTGNVEHLKVESIDKGPVTTRITLWLRHYTNTGEEVLNEKWTMTVYPFDSYFLFDIRSVQLNSSKDTLYLNKYHYGGMSFRGSRQWNKDDSANYRYQWHINTDTQADIKSADGTRASYVSASGRIDGVPGGVTVIGFPSNYNYPQPIRVHPVMPYWCFAPTALGAFTINPSERLVSTYRYYVHNNDPDNNRIQQLNNDIVHPVEVTVLAK
ncbi:DUF6807 domain-containing protein [Flavitalea sp.]|nr:PmoA family protein [Flavitalea sp.]